MATKNGFKHIFTCYLRVHKPKEEILQEFRERIDYAHTLGTVIGRHIFDM